MDDCNHIDHDGSPFSAGCATLEKAHYKYVMRGAILETSGNEMFLCIGCRDGAQAGRIFDVDKITKHPAVRAGKGGTMSFGGFVGDKNGTMKITGIVEQHAGAAVLSGTALKDEIVEVAYPKTCECD